MKKLLVVLAVSLFATVVYAEKRRPAKKAAPAKERTASKKVKRVETPVDPNTRAWLNEIRMKVYRFDPNGNPGKGGC